VEPGTSQISPLFEFVLQTSVHAERKLQNACNRSMFARLACSIGNDSFNGSWCMTFNPEAQRSDSNCPSPTTSPRRRLDRAYQTFLHGLLLDTFQDLCPAVSAGHTPTAKYDDPG
jgi:hypothetical protein